MRMLKPWPLAIALTLFAASAGATETPAMTDCVGTWQAGAPDTMFVTTATPTQLEIVLPPSMKLPGGQTKILLNHADAKTWNATDKMGTTVRFTWVSPDHAVITMKGHSPGSWFYFENDVIRQPS